MFICAYIVHREFLWVSMSEHIVIETRDRAVVRFNINGNACWQMLHSIITKNSRLEKNRIEKRRSEIHYSIDLCFGSCLCVCCYCCCIYLNIYSMFRFPFIYLYFVHFHRTVNRTHRIRIDEKDAEHFIEKDPWFCSQQHGTQTHRFILFSFHCNWKWNGEGERWNLLHLKILQLIELIPPQDPQDSKLMAS